MLEIVSFLIPSFILCFEVLAQANPRSDPIAEHSFILKEISEKIIPENPESHEKALHGEDQGLEFLEFYNFFESSQRSKHLLVN